MAIKNAFNLWFKGGGFKDKTSDTYRQLSLYNQMFHFKIPRVLE